MCNLWLGGIRYVDQASLKLCLLNAGIKCIHHQSPIKIFGFHMHAWFACMYEYHLCAWCLQKPEELSHHSGAGNETRIIWKNKQFSYWIHLSSPNPNFEYIMISCNRELCVHTHSDVNYQIPVN